MSDDDLNHDEPRLSRRESPGVRLAAMREELHWTVEDVAASLNLSPAVIRALEADEYNGLPGPTFVRGYLRAYARLLGIDESDVVDDDLLVSVAPGRMESARPVMRTTPFKPRRSGSGSRTGLVISILVVIVVVAWWLSGQSLVDFDRLLGGGTASGPGETEISIPLGSGGGTAN